VALPRILIIAGSDSGGGAGIQADIKTVTVLGGYAATAVTALTVQDTARVHEVMDVPADFVRRQIDVVLADIGADAVKTGMLHRADIIEAVVEGIEAVARRVPVVVDPVMVASSGDQLLDGEAVTVLKERLIPLARLLTPNVAEAQALTGIEITTPEHALRAGEVLRAEGAAAVLVKGGDVKGEVIYDALVAEKGSEVFESPRIASRNTHGTGCTLASAIATALASGLELREAVVRARNYLRGAIINAPGFGKGHGPLNHGWRLAETTKRKGSDERDTHDRT
jgi:hydroxymethylpyrimidine/phosphomethylpyrimidine kinase